MDPANYDFSIYQGTTFERLMTYKDGAGVVINLSGYSARMKIRKTWGAAVLLELTSGANGGIVLAATSPNITVTITPALTAPLSFEYAVYDLEIESPSGKVDRLLQGRVALNKEVTV